MFQENTVGTRKSTNARGCLDKADREGTHATREPPASTSSPKSLLDALPNHWRCSARITVASSFLSANWANTLASSLRLEPARTWMRIAKGDGQPTLLVRVTASASAYPWRHLCLLAQIVSAAMYAKSKIFDGVQ